MLRYISSRLLPILLLSVASSTLLPAQSRVYVHEVLRADVSARASAMAGSFSTIADDPAGLYYNPALLNTIDSTRISLTAFKHVLDINSGSLIAAGRLEGIGAVGAGISYTNYGSFERTDRTGNVVGTFGSNDIVATVGWGTTLGEGFSAGAAAKAIFSGIEEYSSAALALDGGLYFEDTTKNIQAGLSLLHLGSQVSSFGEENEDLPLDLRLGVSHRLRGLPLLIAVNFSRLLDDSDDFLARLGSFSVGGEFRLSEPLRVRIGYNNRIRQDVSFGASKGLAGLSAGFGVIVSGYTIDYAFNSLSGVGSLHRITLGASL